MLYLYRICQCGYTKGALVAHRYYYAPPRFRTLQYRRAWISLSVSLWNDLADPVFDGVGLSGFKSRANAILLAYAVRALFVFYCFSFPLPYLYGLVFWGWSLWTDKALIGPLSALHHQPVFFNPNMVHLVSFSHYFIAFEYRKVSDQLLTCDKC